MQSALNSVTQNAQSTTFAIVEIAPPHAEPPGIVTFGHVGAEPIAATDRSLVPSQSPSAPPHVLQILPRALASAFAILSAAFCAGEPTAAVASGQDAPCLPLMRASQ